MGWKLKMKDLLSYWKEGAEEMIETVMHLEELIESSASLEEFKERAEEYIDNLLWYDLDVRAVYHMLLSVAEGD